MKKCKHGCGNPPAKNRRECHKCRSRLFKKRNPFRYFYNLHRQKAKQRCIPWKLSFNEFKKIWIESGKWNEKKVSTELTSDGWTMDRKNINKGYEKGNIRIVKIAFNVKVFWEEQRWQVDFRWRKIWSERNNKPIKDCPF